MSTSPSAGRHSPILDVPAGVPARGADGNAGRGNPVLGVLANAGCDDSVLGVPARGTDGNAGGGDPVLGVPARGTDGNAGGGDPVLGVPANAGRGDPIIGRDGRLPAGISPLSSEQQLQWRENGRLNLTPVQRAQLSVAMLNSAPLTPPTVEESSRWVRHTGSPGSTATAKTLAILTWREACVRASRRRFRPVFLDQVQWNQTDPRLASLARAASELNASMIMKYGVPFQVARRVSARRRTDTDSRVEIITT